MGVVRLCWVVVILALPGLNARTVKLVPTETKTVTADGVTHEISRYILVPDDESNPSTNTITNEKIRMGIIPADGQNALKNDISQSKELQDSRAINELNNVKVGVVYDKDLKNRDIKTHRTSNSVNYNFVLGADSNNQTGYKEGKVLEKLFKNSKAVESLKHKANMKEMPGEDSTTKVFYIQGQNGAKSENRNSEGSKSYYKISTHTQTKSFSDLNGVEPSKTRTVIQFKGAENHSGTSKGDSQTSKRIKFKIKNPTKITNIKYTELPINWDSQDAGNNKERSMLTTIGINKTFSLPGKRGRFKIIHEDDEYDYMDTETDNTNNAVKQKYEKSNTESGFTDAGNMKSDINVSTKNIKEEHTLRSNTKYFGDQKLNINYEVSKSVLTNTNEHETLNDPNVLDISVQKNVTAPTLNKTMRTTSVLSTSGYQMVQPRQEHSESSSIKKTVTEDNEAQNKYNIHVTSSNFAPSNENTFRVEAANATPEEVTLLRKESVVSEGFSESIEPTLITSIIQTTIPREDANELPLKNSTIYELSQFQTRKYDVNTTNTNTTDIHHNAPSTDDGVKVISKNLNKIATPKINTGKITEVQTKKITPIIDETNTKTITAKFENSNVKEVSTPLVQEKNILKTVVNVEQPEESQLVSKTEFSIEKHDKNTVVLPTINAETKIENMNKSLNIVDSQKGRAVAFKSDNISEVNDLRNLETKRSRDKVEQLPILNETIEKISIIKKQPKIVDSNKLLIHKAENEIAGSKLNSKVLTNSKIENKSEKIQVAQNINSDVFTEAKPNYANVLNDLKTKSKVKVEENNIARTKPVFEDGNSDKTIISEPNKDNSLNIYSVGVESQSSVENNNKNIGLNLLTQEINNTDPELDNTDSSNALPNINTKSDELLLLPDKSKEPIEGYTESINTLSKIKSENDRMQILLDKIREPIDKHYYYSDNIKSTNGIHSITPELDLQNNIVKTLKHGMPINPNHEKIQKVSESKTKTSQSSNTCEAYDSRNSDVRDAVNTKSNTKSNRITSISNQCVGHPENVQLNNPYEYYHVAGTNYPAYTPAYIPVHSYDGYTQSNNVKSKTTQRTHGLELINNQYLQYILNYLISRNFMIDLKQRYASAGFGADTNEFILAYLTEHLRRIGLSLSQEQLQFLFQQLKNHEAVNQIGVNRRIDVPTANHLLPTFPILNNGVPRMNLNNVATNDVKLLQDNAYLQRYLFADSGARTVNNAVGDLGARIFNLVAYFKNLRIPDVMIINFIVEAKKYLAKEVFQALVTECQARTYVQLGQRVDIIAKQVLKKCAQTKCLMN